MSLKIIQFPCLSDNYGYLIHDPDQGVTGCIDTPSSDAINKALNDHGWRLDIILNTHWHMDHVGGNETLKKQWGCQIIGPAGEGDKIPGIDRAVEQGDKVTIGNCEASVFATPGHTLGHIVYHFEADECAFVGDTVFALGCGRLFEGSPEQMWASLSKIIAFPPQTKLYCAHEYTQANAAFALSVDPTNEILIKRNDEINALRAEDAPTVPSTLAYELETNPFLRPSDPAIRAELAMPTASDTEVFAEIRRRKDNF